MTDVGDIMVGRFVAQYAGQPIINTFGFVSKTAFGTWTEAATALSDQMDDCLGQQAADAGLWVARMTVGYVMSSFDVVDLVPGVGPQIGFNANAVGNQSDDGLPPNDALCITWRTETKGAKARGRTYIPAYTEQDSTNGFWNSVATTAADDIGNALLASFGPEGTGDFTLAVIHRHDTAGPVVPPVAFPIMSFNSHNEVRSLGRRAVGRRIHRTTTPP
jgi:hypothetical protein